MTRGGPPLPAQRWAQRRYTVCCSRCLEVKIGVTWYPHDFPGFFSGTLVPPVCERGTPLTAGSDIDCGAERHNPRVPAAQPAENKRRWARKVWGFV